MSTNTKREEVREFINSMRNRYFTVEFIKKDGSLRTMNCQKGVKKHLKGGQVYYQPHRQLGDCL